MQLKSSQKVDQRKSVEKVVTESPQLRELPVTRRLNSQNSYRPALNRSEWEDFRRTSPSQLKTTLPQSVLKKDLQGINQILEKYNQQEQLQEFKQKAKDQNRLSLRLKLFERHQNTQVLEAKSGVIKKRSSTSFARTQESPNCSQRLTQLSLPKKTYHPGSFFMHKDFRGLIHIDFADALKSTKRSRRDSLKSSDANMKSLNSKVI